MSDNSDILTAIEQKLKAAGISHERDALAYVLDRIFEKYAQYRDLTSRDSMPTSAELTDAFNEVYGHLERIAEMCVENIHVAVWLDEFAKDKPSGESDLQGDFSAAFLTCLRAARETYAHFCKATERGEPLVLQRGDRAVEHRKRTRTESRDAVLIPSLVGWLHLSGLQLRMPDDSGKWDHEHVDAACEIISLILSSQNIPVPAAGDSGLGEPQQGRLRRMVKDAWSALEPTLTNNPPKPPA